MQTPEEMIAAIEYFKKNGKVNYAKILEDGSIDIQHSTACPAWDFYQYCYYPIKEPKRIFVNIYSNTDMIVYNTRQKAQDMFDRDINDGQCAVEFVEVIN